MDIFISDEEAFEEVIPRRKGRFNFPAVRFFKSYRTVMAYFNKHATPMVADAERVQVKISRRFIVFLPSNSRLYNRFTKNSRHTVSLSVGSLSGIVPDGAVFRCYPYKGGIAIKRDEPILDDAK